MKRSLAILLNLVIIAGLTLALWPLGQTAYGVWHQRVLHEQWEAEAKRARTAKPSPAAKVARISRASSSRSSKKVKRKVPEWPSTRLIIPDLGVDTVVLQGWDADTLRRGPAHAPTTGLPGQWGNCAIAAHRNVYGSWFRRVDELMPESLVQLKTPTETFNYRVTLTYSVTDTDTTILQPPVDPQEPPRLTLITCTLPRSANRLVIVAVLEDPNRYH